MASSASSIRASSKRIGFAVPDPLPLDRDVLVALRIAQTRVSLVEHRCELRRVEMPLVEQTFAVSTTDVTNPGLRHTPPSCKPPLLPVRFAISRISSSRRAPLRVRRGVVHRSRAGVSGWPRK